MTPKRLEVQNPSEVPGHPIAEHLGEKLVDVLQHDWLNHFLELVLQCSLCACESLEYRRSLEQLSNKTTVLKKNISNTYYDEKQSSCERPSDVIRYE